MLNIYITSASKGEGKTFLTAGLAATMQSLGYTTSVYKPIQTGGIEFNGFMQSPDLTVVKSVDPYINTHFSYLFKTKSEPLIAAENENQIIDIDFINHEYQKILNISDCTILDGDRGILSPIAPNIQNIDLIKKLQIPLLFVISPSEDSINNSLMSINIAQEKGLDVRGVIINNITEDCSKMFLTASTRLIEEYTNTSILGLIPNIGKQIVPEEMITAILNGIDIESVFKVKIEKLDFN